MLLSAIIESPGTALKTSKVRRRCKVKESNRDRSALIVDGRTILRLGKNPRIILEAPLTIGWERNHLGHRTDRSMLVMQDDSVLKVSGAGGAKKSFFCSGSRIYVLRGAYLEIGSDTTFNANCLVIASKRIIIGRDCKIAWGVQIVDSDHHQHDGQPVTSEVVIGDHVWIGAEAMVMKGVRIGSGAIVAAGSVVVNDVPERSLVAGNPAIVKRTDVNWNV